MPTSPTPHLLSNIQLSNNDLTTSPIDSSDTAVIEEKKSLSNKNVDTLDITSESNSSSQVLDIHNDGQFSFLSLISKFGKGLIEPLQFIVQHPILCFSLLAGIGTAAFLVPVIIPALSALALIGVGASLISAATKIFNLTQDYNKGKLRGGDFVESIAEVAGSVGGEMAMNVGGFKLAKASSVVSKVSDEIVQIPKTTEQIVKLRRLFDKYLGISYSDLKTSFTKIYWSELPHTIKSQATENISRLHNISNIDFGVGTRQFDQVELQENKLATPLLNIINNPEMSYEYLIQVLSNSDTVEDKIQLL